MQAYAQKQGNISQKQRRHIGISQAGPMRYGQQEDIGHGKVQQEGYVSPQQGQGDKGAEQNQSLQRIQQYICPLSGLAQHISLPKNPQG